MELLHCIFHHRNVVSPRDHTRLLELCEEFEFPEYNTPEPDHNYHIKGYRSHVVLEPEDGIIGIGSGGNYALAAAKVMIDTDLSAEEIARKSIKVASDICVFTNDNLSMEKI